MPERTALRYILALDNLHDDDHKYEIRQIRCESLFVMRFIHSVSHCISHLLTSALHTLISLSLKSKKTSILISHIFKKVFIKNLEYLLNDKFQIWSLEFQQPVQADRSGVSVYQPGLI